jgi:hypothetical protein
MNVYQKLNQCRIQLQEMKMNKSGNNKFAGYSYFELGDFLPAVNKLFNEIGLCSNVSFSKEYAELRIINTDKPEEVIAFLSPMAEANLKGCHPIQNLGAVQTYQRRYLYVAAMEIVEHDALDSSKPLLTKTEAFVAKASEKGVTPTAGILENFDEDQRKFIQEFAEGIQVHFDSGVVHSELVKMLEERHLDNEEKIAVWSFLDSKCRSAIKKAKANHTPEELTSQA